MHVIHILLMSYMTQNQKRKQILESAQNGLDINFNMLLTRQLKLKKSFFRQRTLTTLNFKAIFVRGHAIKIKIKMLCWTFL